MSKEELKYDLNQRKNLNHKIICIEGIRVNSKLELKDIISRVALCIRSLNQTNFDPASDIILLQINLSAILDQDKNINAKEYLEEILIFLKAILVQTKKIEYNIILGLEYNEELDDIRKEYSYNDILSKFCSADNIVKYNFFSQQSIFYITPVKKIDETNIDRHSKGLYISLVLPSFLPNFRYQSEDELEKILNEKLIETFISVVLQLDICMILEIPKEYNPIIMNNVILKIREKYNYKYISWAFSENLYKFLNMEKVSRFISSLWDFKQDLPISITGVVISLKPEEYCSENSIIEKLISSPEHHHSNFISKKTGGLSF